MYIAAQIIGFTSTALFACSYQCKRSGNLLAIQLVGSTCYAISLLLLKAYSGFAVSPISIVSYVFLSFQRNGETGWFSWKGWKWIFCASFVATTLLTWHNFYDLLPLIGATSTTLANWTRNGKWIRLNRLFINAPMWLIYSFVFRSYSGIACEIVNVTSIVLSIKRYGLKNLDKV